MATISNDASRIKLSLENLMAYDRKIKTWAANQIDQKKEIFFASKTAFPTTGEINKLYIDGDNIYRWNESTSGYTLINSPAGGETKFPEWETF